MHPARLLALTSALSAGLIMASPLPMSGRFVYPEITEEERAYWSGITNRLPSPGSRTGFKEEYKHLWDEVKRWHTEEKDVKSDEKGKGKAESSKRS